MVQKLDWVFAKTAPTLEEFDELIDDYQIAQNGGTTKERVDARRALKDAYRAALAASAK
jgi:hypothetical protein